MTPPLGAPHAAAKPVPVGMAVLVALAGVKAIASPAGVEEHLAPMIVKAVLELARAPFEEYRTLRPGRTS